MRMWMVSPSEMCRDHLLGEHRELHTLVGTLRAGKGFDGYLENGLLEFKSVIGRHNAIVAEMARRGYQHATPITELPDYPEHYNDFAVDQDKSIRVLKSRCNRCHTNAMVVQANGGGMYKVGDRVTYNMKDYGPGTVVEVFESTVFGATAETVYRIEFDNGKRANLFENARILPTDTQPTEPVVQVKKFADATNVSSNLISLREAHAICGRWLDKDIREGRFEGKRVGRAWYVEESKVIALVKDSATE